MREPDLREPIRHREETLLRLKQGEQFGEAMAVLPVEQFVGARLLPNLVRLQPLCSLWLFVWLNAVSKALNTAAR